MNLYKFLKIMQFSRVSFLSQFFIRQVFAQNFVYCLLLTKKSIKTVKLV